MKIEFNINNYVEFELTEYGAKILNDRYRDSLYCNGTDYKKGKIYRDQLWKVFQIFGEYTSLGLETFCKNATIVLEVKE